MAGRLFVVFTTLLIAFIAYTPQIFIIWPWYGRAVSIEFLQLLVPFNILVGLLLWNYRLCIVTDPGRVPPSWAPDPNDADGYEVKKLTRGPRYCRACENYKPPRTHHCRQCKRCVLRMDHHCPWVNNCVGHYNYGHFVRFLFYVDLACAYHVVMLTWRVTSNTSFWNDPSESELIFIVLNYCTCIPVLLAVGIFSLYHFYSVLTNTTTIEGWEKDKVATLVRRGRIREMKFPYNLGMRRNIDSVLGPNPLIWCCPTVTPGNGLKYPLANEDGSKGEDSEWPPKDPEAFVYPDEDRKHRFELPSTPWTYEHGSLNPELHPTTTRRRKSSRAKAAEGPHASVPPYHPDYSHEDSHDTYPASSESEEDHQSNRPRVFVRRGSEGYEVRPIDREDMLRRYVEKRSSEPGRYQVYVPDPPSEPDSGTEDEVIPLAQKIGMWRGASPEL